MSLVLYTNHCPRCRILENKMKAKGITYEEFTDVEKMIEMGMSSMPVLSVDGNMMDFPTANKWINEQKGAM